MTPALTIDNVMDLAPVIPVLTVADQAHARPIAEALVAGGLRVLEVTLRTPTAFDVIREMTKVDGAIVGAGTVLNAEDVRRSRDAGARFIVSPGLSAPTAEAAVAAGMPFLPGIATASEIMQGIALGLGHFKFFPAEAMGGVKTLKALAAPFHRCRFCPTGGITAENAPAYFALEAVACVGGSWLVPSGTPDVAAITARAKAAARLRPKG